MESSKQAILDQYKMYVETAERVTERRLKINQFYIGLISGLLTVISFILSLDSFSNLSKYESQMLTTVSVLGILLNFVWLANIRSYRQLNRGKFKVILEMEELLPFQPFGREWEEIQHGRKDEKYREFTLVEQYLPGLLSVPFIILLLLSIL